MSYSKETIEKIFADVAKRINISDKLFNDADKEYKALGSWINKKTEEEMPGCVVQIYPQGSFALATVIKPISDEDDYDLDLVCEVNDATDFTARELKNKVVKPWLKGYKRTKTEIEEKRRCWHVEYEELPNFHMDVIPAVPKNLVEGTQIKITDKDEEQNTYSYIGSNPKGYVKWFLQQCNKSGSKTQRRVAIQDMAIQAPIKQTKQKSKLQQAVQLLKRHRDVMFEDDADNKPISIIVTTLAAQLYNGEDSIIETLLGFVNNVETYLFSTKKENGNFSIPNPSYAGEDFADKWGEHPERQRAFFVWIRQLKEDFNFEKLSMMDRVMMGKHIKKMFGSNTGNALFTQMGLMEAEAVRKKELKVDTKTGNISAFGMVAVPPIHHFGKV